MLSSRGVFNVNVDSQGLSEWEFYVDQCQIGSHADAVCKTTPDTTMKIFVDPQTLMAALRSMAFQKQTGLSR